MRQQLRLLTLVSLTAALSYTASAQNIGINRAGAAPHAKAILDLDVSGTTTGNPYQGMLIPRMTRAQRLAIAGLGLLDKGMWVYQTDDGTDPDASLNSTLAHGYWYYEGVNAAPNDWVRWSASNNAWRLTGNGNSNVASNFLGTPALSNDDLYIRTTNNLTVNPAIRINGSGATAGFVGLNLAAAPVEMVDVNGGVQVGNTAFNNAGAIKFDPTAVSPNRFHFGNVDGTATGWKRMENSETRYTAQDYCPRVKQCITPPGGPDGILIQGNYDGTPLPGVANTPFPTGGGTVQQLGHRVQYLYRGTELLALGLCPGNITKFSFYVISGEAACIPNPPTTYCPDVKIDIRMGNTAIADMLGGWDNPTQGSASINVGGTNCVPGAGTAILLQTGWIDFTLSTPFPWSGGNLVIDVSYQRNTPVGISPPVQLEETLPYASSRWVRVTTGTNTNHGCTYDDVALPAGATTGTTTNRPVTRFFGKVQQEVYGAATTGNFINYAGGLVLDNNPTPVWADANNRGPGTIVAEDAVYDGTTQLSDHVFDRYFQGETMPEDSKAAEGYVYIGLPDLKGYLQKERHLPNLPSRDEWQEHGIRPVGELQTGLWESVENQALYITQLEKDLTALESLAFGTPTSKEELDRMIAEVEGSRRLTEEQKLHLSNALRARLTDTPATK